MGDAGVPTEPLQAPVLSLCLATFNRARYLDRYLTHHLAALEASGLDYELVVSDNASTDETPQILARYAAANPRLRVSRQPHNVGAHPNILTTLHQARGEVVVSISDDDLAIPDQLFAYVQRMREDADLVMIQAPWLLMDERKDNAIIGQFYELEAEQRFRRTQFGPCLAFVIERHVFPECWIMRRSVLASVAGAVPRFAYSYHCMLAHALNKGDVLFCPQPHIAATAVAKDANVHVGNTEAMESWDVYRGGLEWLASYARQYNPDALDEGALSGAILGFVCERMAVAARLQAHAKNWSNAYQILRRLHAYGIRPRIDYDHDDVAVLAAIETALLEAVQLGANVIVLGDAAPDQVLERLNPTPGARIVRPGEIAKGDGRRAYGTVGGAPEPTMRDGDFTFDFVAAVDRFPLFPEK